MTNNSSTVTVLSHSLPPSNTEGDSGFLFYLLNLGLELNFQSPESQLTSMLRKRKIAGHYYVNDGEQEGIQEELPGNVMQRFL